MIDHSARGKNTHMVKHCIEKEHKLSSLEDFMILWANHKKYKFRRKVSKSLYIKEKCSSLKTQEKSVPLKLFNWVASLSGTNKMSEVKFLRKQQFLAVCCFWKKLQLRHFWLVFFQLRCTEAAIRVVLCKRVFLEISQNSH